MAGRGRGGAAGVWDNTACRHNAADHPGGRVSTIPDVGCWSVNSRPLRPVYGPHPFTPTRPQWPFLSPEEP